MNPDSHAFNLYPSYDPRLDVIGDGSVAAGVAMHGRPTFWPTYISTGELLGELFLTKLIEHVSMLCKESRLCSCDKGTPPN